MTITIAGFLFPSPYGDCGSYQFFVLKRYNNVVSSFRPLTGIVVLIDDDE